MTRDERQEHRRAVRDQYRRRAAVEMQIGLTVLCAMGAGFGRDRLLALVTEGWARAEVEEEHVVEVEQQRRKEKP